VNKRLILNGVGALMKMTGVEKVYRDSPFVLTEKVYRRIDEVVRERLSRVCSQDTLDPEFDVTLFGNKDITLQNIDDVVRLDNSLARPIVRIVSNYQVACINNKFNYVYVDYDGTSNGVGDIRIKVRSEDQNWSRETIEAIEEQVERSIQNGFWYRVLPNFGEKMVGILVVAFMIIGLLGLLFSSASSHRVGQVVLSAGQYENVVALAKQAKSDSDKINFIFTLMSYPLYEDDGHGQFYNILKMPRTYLVGLPLLMMVSCFFIVLFRYYPLKAFVWGDYSDIYAGVLEKRKFLWYGVIGAAIVGVIANVFVLGMTSF
jgi:hypothetical protein